MTDEYRMFKTSLSNYYMAYYKNFVHSRGFTEIVGSAAHTCPISLQRGSHVAILSRLGARMGKM